MSRWLSESVSQQPYHLISEVPRLKSDGDRIVTFVTVANTPSVAVHGSESHILNFKVQVW